MAYKLALGDAKRRFAAGFNDISRSYDRRRHLSMCANRLVTLAVPQLGECVLDVATGTGCAAIAAAQIVGLIGHVIGIDIAEEMLTLGRRKVAAAGLAHVELCMGDAEHLDLDDDSVDLVLKSDG